MAQRGEVSSWSDVRRGLRRILGVAPGRRARPLLVEDLRHILAVVDRTTPAGKRDAALILLSFAAALRRSELAALEVAYIGQRNGTMPWVCLGNPAMTSSGMFRCCATSAGGRCASQLARETSS